MRDPTTHQDTKKKHICFLFYIMLHIPNTTSTQPTQTAAPFKVGLILDTNYPIGQIALTSIQMAIADFYNANANSTKHLVVVQRDSSSKVLTSASSALELVTRESVHAILGPDTASEVAFVANLGSKTNIPIISYSVTSRSVSHCCSPFFIRATSSDALQVHAIAALVQEYGWRRVVPIYEDDDNGVTLLPFLVDALDNVEAVIPYRCGIRFSATDDHISSELYRLQTLQTRVFVIHTCVQLAVRIFKISNRIGMMSKGYVWILTEGLTNLLGWIESKSVQGVLGVSTQIPDSERLNGFKRRWTRQLLIENPDANPSRVSLELSNYAVWAYDATWALALAAENLGPLTNSTIKTSNGYGKFSTMVVSNIGRSLLQALLNIQFDGLGGKFQLVNGELNMTGACRIVNVVDGMAQEIGVWTWNEGLKRRHRPVIWPGESMVVPKGWDRPTSGKRLRLAVPVRSVDSEFQSFLNLKVDKTTNRTLAKGFVFDMFEAAVRQLPYALLFDYIPVKHDSYDSLVELVINGSYDGIVADMTITAERSMFVDFTQPYKKSGISIVAPAVTDKGSKNTWIFIKPLKPNLWVISAAFFILTGIIIWIMEHRVNQEFRGPRSRHHGTIISFGFSTLAFSHSERMINNFSRVTLIVWLFVVFILTSSYTANLSSILTVKQLKPSVSDINDLKNSAASVGYLQPSFVKNNLLKLGFDKSRLLPLKSTEYADALASGLVAAIVDETPYLEVFINDHCDGYQMSSEIYKTGGFGFVFPKGSMLAADLSRAIMKITESDESSSIQKKWFDLDKNTCSSGDSSLSSKQLGLDSFVGLFCITGVISGLCCVIFFIKFYIQNKDELRNIVANNPWRTSMHKIWKLFYEAADETRNSPRSLVHLDG